MKRVRYHHIHVAEHQGHDKVVQLLMRRNGRRQYSVPCYYHQYLPVWWPATRTGLTANNFNHILHCILRILTWAWGVDGQRYAIRNYLFAPYNIYHIIYVSKAFDRVWHKGLLYKLKRIGVSDALLRWFKSYLKGQKQCVVAQGSSPAWKSINAGVPQGSILGPLLFLVYISLGIRSDINLFAADTSIMKIILGPQCFHVLNTDLDTLHKWSVQWLVEFNAEKSVHMLI
jgi:hypothetical protein